METKRFYIPPVIEVCAVHSHEGIMLQASLIDDEAPFVGAKDNNWDWNQEDDIFGNDGRKNNDVWSTYGSEDQMK